ncbi:MAG: NADP-dependent oxidoreductase, partial [Bryobacteraceae bacterium]
RVCICGQIALYNQEKPELGPRFLSDLIKKRAKFQGMLVSDYFARSGEARSDLSAWYREGKLKLREDIGEGLENAPSIFIGMLRGANTGKQLVKVS